jgi:hypothetical protein
MGVHSEATLKRIAKLLAVFREQLASLRANLPVFKTAAFFAWTNQHIHNSLLSNIDSSNNYPV